MLEAEATLLVSLFHTHLLQVRRLVPKELICLISQRLMCTIVSEIYQLNNSDYTLTHF